MRKHTTQAEIFRINKLLRSGVTDMAEIQTEVFVHAECIQRVITKFNNQSGVKVEVEAEEDPVEAPKPKRRSRKKAAPVDPLS